MNESGTQTGTHQSTGYAGEQLAAAERAVVEQLQEGEPVGCLQMIHLSSEAQVTLFPSSSQPRTEHRSILGSCHFCSKQEFWKGNFCSSARAGPDEVLSDLSQSWGSWPNPLAHQPLSHQVSFHRSQMWTVGVPPTDTAVNQQCLVLSPPMWAVTERRVKSNC